MTGFSTTFGSTTIVLLSGGGGRAIPAPRPSSSSRPVCTDSSDTCLFFSLDMHGEEKRVRLIGVDCPESVHPDKERNVPYGKIASAFTRSQLEGRYVVLTADVSDTDQYGRLLRYVYLDGVLFNEVLVRQGHALAKSYPPNTAQDSVLQAAQTAAQQDKLGMWGYYPADQHAP